MMWLLTAWCGVKRLFGAVLAYPWQAALIVALLACGWLYMGRSQAREQLAKEQAAHIATKVNYKNAQTAAADLNRKQVERIENEFAQIGIKSELEYEKRIAGNRAALDRWMRAQATKGSAQGSRAGDSATVSRESVQGTAQTEFLVSASDLEIAADNYSQLMALRGWALSIGKVDTNAPHD